MVAIEFDPGPPPRIAEHFAALPSYAGYRDLCCYDWGPVFYRGRLDGSARVLGIGRDPGATERIAGRVEVGVAGQRIQGFLARLGLTRSYLLCDAFAYGLMSSRSSQAAAILTDPDQIRWRNAFLDQVAGMGGLQAVVTFGEHARRVVQLWHTRPAVPVLSVAHPVGRPAVVLAEWRTAVIHLRTVVEPDEGAPDYVDRGRGRPPAAGHDRGVRAVGDGRDVTDVDHVRIPAADLPFGVPDWLGDSSRQQATTSDPTTSDARTSDPTTPGPTPPDRADCAVRPADDYSHTVVWTAPPGQP